MRSSISSFNVTGRPGSHEQPPAFTSRDPAPFKAAPIVLIGTLIALLAGFEIFARMVVERHSKVQRLMTDEYREATRVRRAPGGRVKQLLLVGNSMVGHEIDLPLLREQLAPSCEVHRFWIYNTAYDDWYFGLQRLFAEGSRPDAVAVVFAAKHWYASGIRGDYSAQYLFRTEDLPEIRDRLELDRTASSSLLLARYSKAYALRTEIRKVALLLIMPHLPRLYDLFLPGSGKQIAENEIAPLLAGRILSYRQITDRYGAKLVLIVPPIPQPSDEHRAAMRKAAASAGVALVMPLSSADVPPQDYLDDIHLTPDGAKLFTSKAAEQLARATR